MSKHNHIISKSVSHPLEDEFDIEPESTEMTREVQSTDLVVAMDYDDKDNEIESDYQEVIDKAMSGYERIQDELEEVEGRYIPRMMEVGVQHLHMALEAAKLKARMKEHKDKLNAKTKSGPKTVNNTLIIDRNELLREIRKGDSNIIDAEVVETKDEEKS